MHPRAEGFALLAVLVLLAVVGLYTAATLQDTLFGTQLAGTRVLQQRAFSLADLGIEDTLQDLHGATLPADFTRELHPLAGSTDSVDVVFRNGGADALPTGFSAGRFIAHRFEIQSTGHAARGTQSVQVQGVVRIMPLTAPVAP